MGKKRQIWALSYNALIQDLFTEVDAIEDCMHFYINGDGRIVLHHAQAIIKEKQIKKVIFIGNAYNYFASLIPRSELLKTRNLLPFSWECYELSEFYDYILPLEKDDCTLYIFITTSGSSRFIQKILDQLDFLNVDPELLWFISNNPTAEIASNCRFIFPMMIHSEMVLGTKSFMNSVVILHFIARILTNQDPLSAENIMQLQQLLEYMRKFHSEWKEKIGALIKFLGTDFQFLYFISSGAAMGAAYHGALSAKSYCRIFTQAISLGLFFHGPFQIIDDNFRCIILSGYEPQDDEANALLERLLQLISKKLGHGRVVLFTNNPTLAEKLKVYPQIFIISYKCEETAFSPLYSMFLIQFLLLELAKSRELILD
jgi:glucosamine--fructose-6-phosphate aminotransferase (isomerizing)